MSHKQTKHVIYNYVPIVIGRSWSLIVRIEELLLIVASRSVRVETVSVVG